MCSSQSSDGSRPNWRDYAQGIREAALETTKGQSRQDAARIMNLIEAIIEGEMTSEEVCEAFMTDTLPVRYWPTEEVAMGDKMELPGKVYLGDSVYCEIQQSGQICLTTENGAPTDPSNTIYLEPEVFDALALYVERVRRAVAAFREQEAKGDG